MANNQFNPNRDPQKKRENYTLAIAAFVIVLLLVGSFIYFYSSNPAPQRVMVAPTPATPETAPAVTPPGTPERSVTEPTDQEPVAPGNESPTPNNQVTNY